MTNRVVQSACKDSHLDEVFKELMRQAMQCVTTKGTFNLALSESDSLDDMYARLMFDPDLRMFPWGKTELWFFGDSTDVDSIQNAFSAHSGIPEEQVRHVRDGLPEGVNIDCCISDGGDLSDFPDTFAQDCAAWLIVASGNAPTLNLGGVTHVFVGPMTGPGP
jgi:hypothetical protein